MDDWESMMENDVEVKVEGLAEEEFCVKVEEPVYTSNKNNTNPVPSTKTKNLSKKLKQGEIDKKFLAQNNAVNETFGMADPKRRGELLAY